jgi:hypothetical protein
MLNTGNSLVCMKCKQPKKMGKYSIAQQGLRIQPKGRPIARGSAISTLDMSRVRRANESELVYGNLAYSSYSRILIKVIKKAWE